MTVFGATAFAQYVPSDRTGKPLAEVIQDLQYELDELEATPLSELNRSERKLLRKQRKRLRRQLQSAQYQEFLQLQASNPYVRRNQNFYGPWANGFYSPFAFNRFGFRRGFVYRRGFCRF
ncbi:MAG: hypothetical protein AAF206_22300 [Bacteroidota bacterium]